MTLVFEGQSTCPVCGEILDENKAFGLFAPMTNNIKDPLFIFSDAGVHVACIDQSGWREKLDTLMEMYRKSCEQTIGAAKPEDLLLLGVLTSDTEEPLFKFNYLVLNLKEVNNWKDYEEFIFLLQQFVAAGKYKPFMEIDTFGTILKIVQAAKLAC